MSGQAEMQSMSTAMTVFVVVAVVAFVAIIVILIVLMTSSSSRINFFTTQQAKLVGTGNTGPASQGSSVAISRDGNTLAVGGYSNNTFVGAVWVFVRAATTNIWTQQQILTTSDTSVNFGSSVAISDDGNTIVAGGNATGGNVGGVWVFNRVGAVWTQQGTKILPVTYPLVGVNTFFGGSLSISGNGSMFVAGTFGDSAGAGAAYIYEKVDSVWTEKQKLVGTGAVGAAGQGASVRVSEDGAVIAVGGTNDNTQVGATWLYTRSGSTYVQAQKVVGTGGVGTIYQGSSVALNSSGNILAVGGNNDANVGAVWVFERKGLLWEQQGSKLVGTSLIGSASFGSSVVLNGSGNVLAVSCPGNNSGEGGFFAFIYDGANWIQKENARTLPSGAINAPTAFGLFLSMSRDGNTLAVSAISDNTNEGAAYVFV